MILKYSRTNRRFGSKTRPVMAKRRPMSQAKQRMIERNMANRRQYTP